MLYDPKWERPVETKPDPYSLASLIAWLETMPANVEYDAHYSAMCLLGEWCAANGLRDGELRWKSLRLGEERPFDLIAFIRPWNFGAALERARSSAAMKSNQR